MLKNGGIAMEQLNDFIMRFKCMMYLSHPITGLILSRAWACHLRRMDFLKKNKYEKILVDKKIMPIGPD